MSFTIKQWMHSENVSHQSKWNHLSIVIVFAIVASLLSSCTKFSPTEQVDFAPFAGRTISLLSEKSPDFIQNRALLVMEHIDIDSPELTRFRERKALLASLVKGLIAYSIEIVRLSDSDMSDQDKAIALAAYLEALEKPLSASRGSTLSPTQFHTILEEVRTQETLLDALRAAQPLINEVARYGSTLLDDSEQAILDLVQVIESNINVAYAALLTFSNIVNERKQLAIEGLEILHDYSRDNLEILKQALEKERLHLEEFLPFTNLSIDEMLAIEQHFINRLTIMQKIREQLEPDLHAYQEAHRELNRLQETFRLDVRRARFALIVWTRAHQKMASGITDPAEWFDIKNVPGELFDLGKKAIDTAL